MLFHKHPHSANFAFASDLRPGKAKIGNATVNGRKVSPASATLRIAGAEQKVWTVR